MHFDNLFQFIVPLTFLAIWALTSLFNREAQPLPPRTGRPLPPGGPGSGPGSGPGGASMMNRDPTLRWGPPADRPTPRRPAVGGRPDEEILIIEETRRPSSTPPGSTSPMITTTTTTTTTTIRPGAGGGSRRGGRPRPAPAVPTRRPEPSTPRLLSGSLTSTPFPAAPQSTYRPLDRGPLNMPPSPLLTPKEPRELSKASSDPSRTAASRPALGPDDWRLALGTPSKLREAIIANEILQPPLALRRRPVP
jgi:hypothetical protein